MGGRPIPVPAGGFRDIAVLRLSSLGDVILTLPAVRALKRAFPAARISYWTKQEYAGVLAHEPAIAHLRLLEPDARRLEDLVSMSAELEGCDLIVDLHGSLRTRLLCFRQRAPVVRAAAARLLRARWVHARWSRPRPAPHALERYAAALRSRAAAGVSGDRGLMPLAAARGLPVVALFGSTAPELGFAPAGAGHEVLCRHEPCQPCTLHGRERCPRRHFRCMEGITPAQPPAPAPRPRRGRAHPP